MTHAFSITRIKETAMSSTKTRRALYFRKTSLILALALASVTQAKDWSFSKDTLLEPYDVADSVGRWVTYYDSVDVINHTEDTIYLDSVASKIVKPLNKYCTYNFSGGNRNDFGFSHISDDIIRPDTIRPSTVYPYVLNPKGKTMGIELGRLLAYECKTYNSPFDSITIEMILFTRGHGQDTLYLQGYASLHQGNNALIGLKQTRPNSNSLRKVRKHPIRFQWLLGRMQP